jgi:hypothetical protein
MGAYNTSGWLASTDDRYKCRNLRCRIKLPAPVSNPRDAFCCRGCFDSFYLRRCLVCEAPIEQAKRGRPRLICKKSRCRAAFRADLCLGKWVTSSTVINSLEVPNFIGPKLPLKPDRPLRIIAGPQETLSVSQFHCAGVGAARVIEQNNRLNTEGACLIKRDSPPINVVGGFKFPDSPAIPDFLQQKGELRAQPAYAGREDQEFDF